MPKFLTYPCKNFTNYFCIFFCFRKKLTFFCSRWVGPPPPLSASFFFVLPKNGASNSFNKITIGDCEGGGGGFKEGNLQ